MQQLIVTGHRFTRTYKGMLQPSPGDSLQLHCSLFLITFPPGFRIQASLDPRQLRYSLFQANIPPELTKKSPTCTQDCPAAILMTLMILGHHRIYEDMFQHSLASSPAALSLFRANIPPGFFRTRYTRTQDSDYPSPGFCPASLITIPGHRSTRIYKEMFQPIQGFSPPALPTVPCQHPIRIH